MKIIWSAEAKSNYEKIIDDILASWSVDVAESFVSKTNELLELLVSHKHLCQASFKNPKLRKCIIHRNTSLIYQLDERNKVIEIVAFIDNRSLHNF